LMEARMALDELGEAEQHVGEDAQVGAGLAAHAYEELEAADAGDHVARFRGGERRHSEADVLEDFDVFAAESEHEERTETRIGGDAEDDLMAAAGHLLDEKAFGAMAGADQRGGHLGERAAHFLLGP